MRTVVLLIIYLLEWVTISAAQDVQNRSQPDAVCPAPMLSPNAQARGAAVIVKLKKDVETGSLHSQGLTTAFVNQYFPFNTLGPHEDPMFPIIARNNLNFTHGAEPSFLLACFPDLKALYLAAQETEQKVVNQTDEEKKKPSSVLLMAYQNYIYIKSCHDERKGYLVINISDEELERAKTAARNIETLMVQTDPSLNKDAIWQKANENRSGFSIVVETFSKNPCKSTLGALENLYAKYVPHALDLKKDF